MSTALECLMATHNINNRKDILLLLLYSSGAAGKINEPVIGRTRLIKLLFLFKKEALPHFKRGTDVNDENFYNFFAWNFGPFSAEIYDDITFFTLRGFVASKTTTDEILPEEMEEWDNYLQVSGVGDFSVSSGEDYLPSDQEYLSEEFYLTEKGKNYVEKNLWGCLSDTQKELLTKFKSKLCSIPLRTLLRYVYTTYEDMTTKSKIKGEILD
jgi:uncharacterized protein YwgA